MIAAGLMFITMFVGLWMWGGNIGREKTALYLFVYASLVDQAFRHLRIMPTLDGMYEALDPVTSMFWAGGPIAFSYVLASKLFS